MIQTEVTVWKRTIQVKIDNFSVLCDLEILQMTLKNNRAPLLCCFKLCASFQIHGLIQTGVTIRKPPTLVKIDYFFCCVTLKFGGWPLKQKGICPKQHQALCIISSPYVNSNWSYGPEKAKLGLTSVTLTFDLWPYPVAWKLLLSLVITSENFMMIQWWEHSEKAITNRQMDRRTDRGTDWANP